MSQTQAEAEVMAATAAKFDSANEDLQSMLRRLMSELESLQSAWKGAGGRSFQQVKEAWAVDQSALQRALTETSSAIRTSGQQYSATDAEAAHRVGASHAGINLPL